MAISAKKLLVRFEDDAFEAKMNVNFKLMQQEVENQIIRRQALEERLVASANPPPPDKLTKVRREGERRVDLVLNSFCPVDLRKSQYQE